ncbi:response regulator [Nostoc sp. PA-18-2419]|uniref:response regulator n=1 Tax=Nostoc sp. PA-18-2419 TaxID=2575443 RepID=UPI001107C6F4|nr:response regulator [Nostoc sp. PA-18-2419]
MRTGNRDSKNQGSKLSRHLGAPRRDGATHAIALSMNAGDFNQQSALQAKFLEHLAKPVKPEALIRAIAFLIGRSGNG